jgi:hypothetical protein
MGLGRVKQARERSSQRRSTTLRFPDRNRTSSIPGSLPPTGGARICPWTGLTRIASEFLAHPLPHVLVLQPLRHDPDFSVVQAERHGDRGRGRGAVATPICHQIIGTEGGRDPGGDGAPSQGKRLPCPANALPRPGISTSSRPEAVPARRLELALLLASFRRYPHPPGNGLAVGQLLQVPYARPGAVAVQMTGSL